MTEFLKTLGFYLSSGGIIAFIILITYWILEYLAKQNVQKELKAQQDELEQQRNILDKRKQQIKFEAEQKAELLLQKEKTILNKHYEATETLVKAEKLREEMEQKLARLSREKHCLRNDLEAARQRAKRLANKAKTAV